MPASRNRVLGCVALLVVEAVDGWMLGRGTPTVETGCFLQRDELRLCELEGQASLTRVLPLGEELRP